MAIMTAGVLYPAYALIGDSSVKPLLTTKDYEYLFNKNNPISSYNLTAAGWAAAGIHLMIMLVILFTNLGTIIRNYGR